MQHNVQNGADGRRHEHCDQLNHSASGLALPGRSVMIAVIAVLMVQMAIDDIVDVPVVFHRFVAAALAVHMPVVVALTIVTVPRRRAVVVAVVPVDVVQVAIDDIIGVAVMLDGLVAAALAVRMVAVVVFTVVVVPAHDLLLPLVRLVRPRGGDEVVDVVVLVAVCGRALHLNRDVLNVELVVRDLLNLVQ